MRTLWLATAAWLGGMALVAHGPRLGLNLLASHRAYAVPEMPDATPPAAPTDGRMVLDPADIVAMATPPAGARFSALHVAIDDIARAKVSLQMDPLREKYLNIEVSGTIRVEDGRVDKLHLDTAQVGRLQVPFVTGRDLAAAANRQLGRLAESQPDLARYVDQIELLELSNGQVVLELTDQGWKDWNLAGR